MVEKFAKEIGQMMLDCYYWAYPKYRAKALRSKKRPICVVFVLCDLPTWKSENLYLVMKQHERFAPMLAVTRNENLKGHEIPVVEYLEKKNYDYIKLDESKNIVSQTQADIICYQRVYCEEPFKHRYYSNMKALHIYVPYAFNSLKNDWAVNRNVSLRAWQNYYENALSADFSMPLMRNHGRNVVVTGTPVMDNLALPKSEFDDPWRFHDSRKRIIWAPHHTIGNDHMEGIAYSTFLDVADDMLNIAREYKDSVAFAFKPHPHLYVKLVEQWGEKRASEYYDAWKNMENAQFEGGEYMGLFKHSDAMVHDCASFTMEYLATGNPVMYIVRAEKTTDNMNECAKQSFQMHYHGTTATDIRCFIDMVIANEDPRREERISFINANLRPPHGKTACENIINAILGKEEYK